MSRKKGTPRARPWERAKLQRSLLTPDQEWASTIERRIHESCHPFQLEAVIDPSPWVSMLCGRGGGKTATMRARAIIKMVKRRRAKIIFVALSKDNAEELLWGELKDTIERLGLSDEFSFHETKLRCTCKRTGSTYRLVGADDKREIEKLRGRPFDEVQLDEAASHDVTLVSWLIDRAVGPRLGERRGAFLIAGTPGHVLLGDFYNATRPGSESHRPYADRDLPEFAEWEGWSSHHWTAEQVTDLPDAERLWPSIVANWHWALKVKRKNNWGDDNPIWLREYKAVWAADDTLNIYAYQAHREGKPWNQWKPYGDRKLEGVAALQAAIKALPDEFVDYLYGYGLDLGARDPFALTVLAFSPSDAARRFWHVYSFERRRMYAKTIAELLIGPEAVAIAMRGEIYTTPGGLFGLTGWPVAIVADLAGLGDAIILELQNVYGIRIKAADKSDKFGAIEVTNGDLGDGRMHILAGSPLETQLGTLQWKLDDFGQRKENKADANHSSDSLIYIRTELGAMFAAADAESKKHEDRSPPGADPARRGRKRDTEPAKADAWTDAPMQRRGDRGEFDSLLDGGDLGDLGWGTG